MMGILELGGARGFVLYGLHSKSWCRLSSNQVLLCVYLLSLLWSRRAQTGLLPTGLRSPVFPAGTEQMRCDSLF